MMRQTDSTSGSSGIVGKSLIRLYNLTAACSVSNSRMLDNLVHSWMFSERPRVFADGHVLVIADGWKSHLKRLGCYSRMTRIDPKAKIVRLQGRRFWFASWSRAIPFSRIEQIEYGYDEIGGGFEHQEHDRFTADEWRERSPVQFIWPRRIHEQLGVAGLDVSR